MVPTKQQCEAIVAKCDAFYKNTKVLKDGTVLDIFNYRLAHYADFRDNNAFELRGLTFATHTDGTEKVYPMLPKFFNLNETESTMLPKLKDKKIHMVTDKYDGTLISFVQDSSGNIVPRTKQDVYNQYTEMATEAIAKQDLADGLKTYVCTGKRPIFELVSPWNRIVVQYPTTELKYLYTRLDNGDWINHPSNRPIPAGGIVDKWHEKCRYNGMTLSSLEKEVYEYKGIEGVVVVFEDMSMVKIKTEWYRQLHRLLTEDVAREDYVIKMLLEEKLDDVLAVVPPDDPRKTEVIAFANRFRKAFLARVEDLFSFCDHICRDKSVDRKCIGLNFPNTLRASCAFNLCFKGPAKMPNVVKSDVVAWFTAFVLEKACNELTKTLQLLKEWQVEPIKRGA